MTKKADGDVEKVRPLNATATRNLMKLLIQNDFDTLRKEMEEFTEDQISAEVDAIKGDNSRDDIKSYRDKAKAMIGKFNIDYENLCNEALDVGIRIEKRNVSEWINVENEYDKIRSRIRKEKQADLARAQLTLTRKQREVERKVLIASVTSDAEKILNDLPTAREVMLEAAAEKSRRMELK